MKLIPSGQKVTLLSAASNSLSIACGKMSLWNTWPYHRSKQTPRNKRRWWKKAFGQLRSLCNPLWLLKQHLNRPCRDFRLVCGTENQSRKSIFTFFSTGLCSKNSEVPPTLVKKAHSLCLYFMPTLCLISSVLCKTWSEHRFISF